MISSYEEYMLKSHLLSKMYLQQYCSSGLNIANNTNNTNNSDKIQKAGKSADGRRGRRKEGGVESPLDLSTRTLEGQQALKEQQLYPRNFPFASLQQMLLHSASREGKTPPSQHTSPSPSPATPESAGEASKELSYVCPICGQMFGLHDR